MTRGSGLALAAGMALAAGLAAAQEGEEILGALARRSDEAARRASADARREVAGMIEKALAERAPAEATAPSEPERRREGGYLGMFIREEAGGGIRIVRVRPGSGAEAAGLRAGDVVLGSRGRKVPNGDEFIRAIWGGRTRSLDVRRAGEPIEVPISTKELDAHPAVGEKAPDFDLPTSDGSGRVRLVDLLAKGRPVVLVFGSYT